MLKEFYISEESDMELFLASGIGLALSRSHDGLLAQWQSMPGQIYARAVMALSHFNSLMCSSAPNLSCGLEAKFLLKRIDGVTRVRSNILENAFECIIVSIRFPLFPK